MAFPMIRRTALALCLGAAALIAMPASAADNPKVTQEIIAIVKAQWASEIAHAPAAQQLSAVADDYSEFNPDYSVRIDGKPTAVAMADLLGEPFTVFGEMENAKVQTYGDTAVLTYNYIGLLKNKDGTTKAVNGKSTRVYVREAGKWMLVHAHFSPGTVAG